MQNDKSETVELEVQGMTCNSCAMSVQRVLEKGGAKDVVVNYATNEAKFTKTPEVSMDTLVHNIEDLGYKVVKDHTDSAEKKND